MVSRDAVHNLSTRLCSDRSAGRVHQVHRLSIKSAFLAYKKLLACSFVVYPKNQVNTRPSSQSIGLRNAPMRTSHPSGSRLLSLPKGKNFSAPGSFEPQKIIGTKPCPIVLTTTGLMVLRRNGPDPGWFKAWAYQLFIIVDNTMFSRLNGLPIRPDGY